MYFAQIIAIYNQVSILNHCCPSYRSREWEEWHEAERSISAFTNWNKCFRLELCTFFVLLLKYCLMPHKSLRRGSAALVPCVHLLMPQREHLLHPRDSHASEAFIVLAQLDGLQPLRHRSEHCDVTAASAGQADGSSEEQWTLITHHSMLLYWWSSPNG